MYNYGIHYIIHLWDLKRIFFNVWVIYLVKTGYFKEYFGKDHEFFSDRKKDDCGHHIMWKCGFLLPITKLHAYMCNFNFSALHLGYVHSLVLCPCERSSYLVVPLDVLIFRYSRQSSANKRTCKVTASDLTVTAGSQELPHGELGAGEFSSVLRPHPLSCYD